jgi:monoterpene epsilon-lactone hydrolase
MTAIDEIGLIKELHALTPSSDDPDVAFDRMRYDAAADAFAPYIHSRLAVETLGEVKCELHLPAAAPAGTIVYLHGGGYVLGSPRSHRHLAAEIGRQTGCLVVVPEYSLAPEHPFPAALDDVDCVSDAVSVRWPDLPTVLIGDSAGAGLAIAATVRARANHRATAGAIVAISPWVDLTCSGPRYAEGAAHDGSLNPRRLKAFARLYLGAAHPAQPLVSPLFADFHELPSLLVQVGRDEILHDEAVALAHRAEAAGATVSLEVWDNVVHVWHWYWPLLASARAAITRAAQFVERAGRMTPHRSVANACAAAGSMGVEYGRR